jgi:hypothetical protein
MVETDKLIFNAPLVMVESLNAFRAKLTAKRQAYSIALNETRLDFEIYPKDSKVLVVFLAGAKPQNKEVTLPFFLGRKLASSTDANCLFISDPAFYLTNDLRLAWYGGTVVDPMQTMLPDLIQLVADKLGAERILFFGGSGGGFAGMYLSKQLDNSMALVWNPQIVLENYIPRIIKAYANTAWKCEVALLAKSMCTNLAELYSSQATRSNNLVAYMQNITDHHVKNHLTPFLAAHGIDCPATPQSGWLNPSIFLHLSNWREGHKPPPYAALSRVLREFSSTKAHWTPFSFAGIFAAAEEDARQEAAMSLKAGS